LINSHLASLLGGCSVFGLNIGLNKPASGGEQFCHFVQRIMLKTYVFN